MMPKKIQLEFRIAFVLLALIISLSYWLILKEGPFFNSLFARIYFVLMTSSMLAFASLLENYWEWDKSRPEKLKERFQQITFLLVVPYLFLILTDWGYTLFLVWVMGIPLGLAIAEDIPIFHYIKITKKKATLTAVIFVLLYWTAKTTYGFGFFQKEIFYILLISHMISSIISNFLFRIQSIRKKLKKKKMY